MLLSSSSLTLFFGEKLSLFGRRKPLDWNEFSNTHISIIFFSRLSILNGNWFRDWNFRYCYCICDIYSYECEVCKIWCWCWYCWLQHRIKILHRTSFRVFIGMVEKKCEKHSFAYSNQLSFNLICFALLWFSKMICIFYLLRTRFHGFAWLDPMRRKKMRC